MLATYDAFGPVEVVHFQVQRDFHPVHYRMTAYKQWLEKYMETRKAESLQSVKVLVVDSLDMAFQTDPFALFDDRTLLVRGCSPFLFFCLCDTAFCLACP